MNPLRYLVLSLSLVLVFGCSQNQRPSDDSTAMSPSFALPCVATATCAALDPCADANYLRCSGFHGLDGVKRQLAGRYGELGFRIQPSAIANGVPISLWHDVPLIVSEGESGFVVNAYFEISRGTQAKLELNKWARHNPIWQDRKKVAGQDFERPRYLAWSPEPSNYGALPRTWENVLEDDPRTGYPGDTDPIDVVDIGSKASPAGLVYRCKVIGALGMIDGNELQTDWKIYVINLEDPMAEAISDITDVPRVRLDQWGLFWRFYHTAAGSRQNFFYAPGTTTGFSADPHWLGASEARQVVEASAASYQKMIRDQLWKKVDPPYWVPDLK